MPDDARNPTPRRAPRDFFGRRIPDEWSWWHDDDYAPPARINSCLWDLGSRPPAPKARNLTTQRKDHADYVRDGGVLMAEKGVTPLDYLQSVMEGEEHPTSAQMQAAVAILPYKHRKQPVAVENSGPDGKPVEVNASLAIRFVKAHDGRPVED